MEFEVYEIKTKCLSADIEAGKLKTVKSYVEKAYAVRAIVNGKVGFASSSDLETAKEMALKLAKVSEEELDCFPVDKPKSVEGIYDNRFEDLNVDYLKSEVEVLFSSVEKANIASATIEHEMSEVRITNTFGLDCIEKSTYSSLVVEIVYDSGSSYEIDESRTIELDIENTAKKAEELAIESSKAEKIESGYYDVVLEPFAIHQIFYYALYPSFSAENVYKGRSRIKIGDYIGKISLIDDSSLNGGLFSHSFDDEGISAKKTVLVDDGIVKSYYTDWRYSRIMNIEATSNGFREDYSTPPVPSPSNVVVKVDEKADYDNALVIYSLIGAHTSNPVSGDFSLECMNAEFKGKAVKGTMIYGNVFEILKRIEGRCGKPKQVENTVTPPIRFSRLRIV